MFLSPTYFHPPSSDPFSRFWPPLFSPSAHLTPRDLIIPHTPSPQACFLYKRHAFLLPRYKVLSLCLSLSPFPLRHLLFFISPHFLFFVFALHCPSVGVYLFIFFKNFLLVTPVFFLFFISSALMFKQAVLFSLCEMARKERNALYRAVTGK